MREYSKKYLCLTLLLFSTINQAATIQVTAKFTEPIEDGLCSISEAIIAANTDKSVDGCSAGQGEDTILLENSRYEMTKVNNFSDGPNGFPVIQSKITIQSNTFDNQKRSRSFFPTIRRKRKLTETPEIPVFRFFQVANNAVLRLNGLEFQNGSTYQSSSINEQRYHGGAVLNNGTLILNHVSILGNGSSGHGGGIYSSGAMVINNNSEFDGNRSINSGGGIAGTGTLLIRESSLEKNSAVSGGALNFISTVESPNNLSIINTVFSQNRAEQGGAIFVDSGVNLKLLQTTIYKNTATKSAGGIFLQVNQQIGSQNLSIIGNSLIAINDGGDCQLSDSSLPTITGNWVGDTSCHSQALGDPGILDGAFFSSSGNFFYNQSDSIISANSVLIDSGDKVICADPLIGNQDILGGSRIVDGNGIGGVQCDIGAIERQQTSDPFNTREMFAFIGSTNISSQWKNQTIDQTAPNQYAQLVFVSPPTVNGKQQGVIRMRSIYGCCTPQLLASISPPPPLVSVFNIVMQEYAYLDQWHVTEQVSVLGSRPGIARAENGETILSGSFDLSGTRQWSKVQFPNMNGIPRVFLSIQSFNGIHPINTRVRNVTSNSFEAALFEEDAFMQSGHVPEKIAYLLVFSSDKKGFLAIGEQEVPYQTEQVSIDHRWTQVLGAELKLDEEQSVDDELFHVKETIDVLRIGEHLFAQQVSDNGADTTSLRIR